MTLTVNKTKVTMSARSIITDATDAKTTDQTDPMRLAARAVRQATEVKPAAMGYRIRKPVRTCRAVSTPLEDSYPKSSDTPTVNVICEGTREDTLSNKAHQYHTQLQGPSNID